MATFDVTGGPSKFDLSLSLFDRPADLVDRPVSFRTGDASFSVTVRSIEKKNGSCEGWVIKGKITEGSQSLFGQYITIEFDTKARRGRMELFGDGKPEEYVCYQTSGYQICKAHGVITSIMNTSTNQVVDLGQFITATEDCPVPFGASKKGVVIKLCEPYTNGCTTDIVHVWFERATTVAIVKPKEINSM